MGDFTAIGHAFVQHYYSMFDTNRHALAGLLREQSMLTWEGKQMVGTQQIMSKLAGRDEDNKPNLGFESVIHQVKSADCQPSGCGGIMVFVVGELKVDGGDFPIKFSELFHLVPVSAGSKDFWVHNDLFRLNYA